MRILLFVVDVLLVLCLAAGCNINTGTSEKTEDYVPLELKYFEGVVEDIIREPVENTSFYKTFYKTTGYIIKVTDDVWENFEIGAMVTVKAKYFRNSPEDGPMELKVNDNVKVHYLSGDFYIKNGEIYVNPFPTDVPGGIEYIK